MSDLVNRLETLIAEIDRRLYEDKDCEALVAEVNALSGCDYPTSFFFELHSWTSPREVAERAALGPAPKLSAMSREQILASIEIITSAKEPAATYHLELLDTNFPHSDASGLLFHPHAELSDEQIIDELVLRQRLHEEGGIAAVHVHLRELAAAVMRDPDRKPWSERWARSLIDTHAGSA